MATKPTTANFVANSVQIMNAIRNDGSPNYQNYVPVANSSLESVREIGAIIMEHEAIRNEFLHSLLNRIGLVVIKSRLYTNPLAFFKKGFLDAGETIEEIFVNLAKPQTYDPARAESEVFKREFPDVRTAFHHLNYRTFYKETIQNNELRLAFLTWEGVTDLIAKIVEAMYTSANYDELLIMKYMIVRNVLDGRMKSIQTSQIMAGNMNDIAKTFKATSNAIEFMSSAYNPAGVRNFSKKETQYLLLDSTVDAAFDVDVLASAFNMNKADFLGHRILVDSFANLDIPRLQEIFADAPEAIRIPTQEELDSIANNLVGVLIDRDWFMIYDHLMEFTEIYNSQGLYWNYFLHVWKVFSVSPFETAISFVGVKPGVTSVTVSPQTATVYPGSTISLTPTVVTTGFANKSLQWEITSGDQYAEVDIYGTVTIKPNAPNTTEITVKATSVFDPSKTTNVTLTVSA